MAGWDGDAELRSALAVPVQKDHDLHEGEVGVVDDEQSMREFLEIFFRREGFDVVTTGDVDSALLAVESDDFEVVISDVKRRFFDRKSGVKQLSLHSRVALSASALLIVLGAVAILGMEWHNTLAPLSVPGRLTAALFQSISARTAPSGAPAIISTGSPVRRTRSGLRFSYAMMPRRTISRPISSPRCGSKEMWVAPGNLALSAVEMTSVWKQLATSVTDGMMHW